VSSFVTGSRKKKSNVENESEREELRREFGHRSESLEFHAAESKQRS
jgi:hypothetical protein